MDWVEIAKHCLHGIIFGLAVGLLVWTFGTALRSLIKSSFALNLIRLLVLFYLVLVAFEYFPKWFGNN